MSRHPTTAARPAAGSQTLPRKSPPSIDALVAEVQTRAAASPAERIPALEDMIGPSKTFPS
ncbi:hypothetical protein [Oceanicola sp. 502str15]|uniref:hypothetical protein n=1 Tax=Oceanicola sp. 502str15 TaxID=2696061 RepID=UPI0020947144|nr:hypothetical protein [Oceanicola sp. 502str15]MCO6383075.1 hypothetical protein [Oceanicola sp. 502str15]